MFNNDQKLKVVPLEEYVNKLNSEIELKPIPIEQLEKFYRSDEYRHACLQVKLEDALMEYKEIKEKLKELNEEREQLEEIILNILQELSVKKEEIIEIREEIGI